MLCSPLVLLAAAGYALFFSRSLKWHGVCPSELDLPCEASVLCLLVAAICRQAAAWYAMSLYRQVCNACHCVGYCQGLHLLGCYL